MSDEKQVTVVSRHNEIVAVVEGDGEAAKRWRRAMGDGWSYTYSTRTVQPAPPDTVRFGVTLSVKDAETAASWNIAGGDHASALHGVARAARIALENHFAALDAREEK